MTIRRKRTSVGVAVLVAAVAVGAFLAAGASARQSALPRSPDAVHVGHGLGAVHPVQPAPLERQRDRHDRAPLRDPVPVRPAEGQVHPVARHERQVGRHHVRRHAAQGRDVERRQAVHRCGREVHVRDRQARGLRALDDVEDRPPEHRREGERRQLPLQGPAELPRLGDEHLHVRHRPGARVEELRRQGDRHRQHRQVLRRHRAVQLRRRQGDVRDAAVEPPRQLVGDEAPRRQDADEVHRRHPQHAEHRVAAELPAEQHRPLEQLLPGDRQADRREGADVLRQAAVHAVGEHRVADPEHDEGAAQRLRLPTGARHVDQRRPDRQGRLREHRREGEPDRPAADLEQVDRQGPGREARVQVQHRGGQGAARGERLQGHERRRLRRERRTASRSTSS